MVFRRGCLDMLSDKLAPGVMRNVLVHGAAVALAPVVAFFLLNYLGFSDVWCAIGT